MDWSALACVYIGIKKKHKQALRIEMVRVFKSFCSRYDNLLYELEILFKKINRGSHTWNYFLTLASGIQAKRSRQNSKRSQLRHWTSCPVVGQERSGTRSGYDRDKGSACGTPIPTRETTNRPIRSHSRFGSCRSYKNSNEKNDEAFSGNLLQIPPKHEKGNQRVLKRKSFRENDWSVG